MSVLRIYVLRHGEPADTGMFYGHHDVDLSERGHEQIAAQVRALSGENIDAIYASDLGRARFGALALAEARGLEVCIEPDLREMHLGHLECLPHTEAARRYPELASRSYMDMLDFRMPGGGESVRDLAERVYRRVDAIVDAHRGAPARTVLLYAHNTVNRVLLSRAVGLGAGGYGRFAQQYGAINRIDLPLASRVSTARQSPTSGGKAVDASSRGAAIAIRDPWSRAVIAACNVDPFGLGPGQG